MKKVYCDDCGKETTDKYFESNKNYIGIVPNNIRDKEFCPECTKKYN